MVVSNIHLLYQKRSAEFLCETLRLRINYAESALSSELNKRRVFTWRERQIIAGDAMITS